MSSVHIPDNQVSQETQETPESQAYLRALGLTPEYIADITQAVHNGDLELAQVAGFTAAELHALYLQGMDLMRRGGFTQAGQVFFYLAQLDRGDGRYYRGMAQAFHNLREFGWAVGCYNIALRLHADDRIAMALKAECTLFLHGKRAAHEALSHVLALGPRDSEDQPFFERAAQILAKIRL